MNQENSTDGKDTLAALRDDPVITTSIYSDIRKFIREHARVFFNTGLDDCDMEDEDMCFVSFTFDFPKKWEFDDFEHFCNTLISLANADYPGDWEFHDYNHETDDDDFLIVILHRTL